jgi:P pilus assembly chaperone PapD
VAAASPASAQGPFTVEVSPLRVELKMAAGASHTQAVTLRNDSRRPVHVRARVDEYFLSMDGTPQFTRVGADEPFSAAGWLRLNPTEFTIEAGATFTVRVTATVPKGVADGGYRCGVMFEFDPPGTDPRQVTKDVMFRGRIATIYYVTVGKPVPVVTLTDLQARQSPDGQLWVVAVLKNTSRASVRTAGSLVISSAQGGSLRKIDLPNVPVLPMSEREVRIPTAGPDDPPLGPGQYRVEVRIDVGLPAVIVGETMLEVGKGP